MTNPFWKLQHQWQRFLTKWSTCLFETKWKKELGILLLLRNVHFFVLLSPWSLCSALRKLFPCSVIGKRGVLVTDRGGTVSTTHYNTSNIKSTYGTLYIMFSLQDHLTDSHSLVQLKPARKHWWSQAAQQLLSYFNTVLLSFLILEA